MASKVAENEPNVEQHCANDSVMMMPATSLEHQSPNIERGRGYYSSENEIRLDSDAKKYATLNAFPFLQAVSDA